MLPQNKPVSDPIIFLTLTENSLDAVILSDLHAKIIYANRAAYLLFGYDLAAQDMIDMDGTRLWLEEDWAWLKGTLIPQVMAGGWNGEARQRRADGTIFEGHISGFMVQNAANQLAGIAIVIHDISARKQAERQLRESEENLRSVFTNMQDAFYRTDANGYWIWFTPSTLTMLGCDSPDQLLGHKVEEFYVTPSARQAFLAELEHKQSVTDYEVVLRRMDGRVITVGINSHLYYDAAGQVAGVEGMFRDITARKQAEADLIDEKNFANAVLDSLPGVFYLYDAEGHLLRWNKNFPAALEMSDAEMRNGYYVMDNIAEEHRGIIAERMQQVFIEGQTEDMEIDLISHKGTRMPYQLTGRRVMMGNQVYLTGVGLDLSARKQAEAETRRLQEQVIEAQRHALQELSTPIIPVLDRIIVMPLIGSIDTLRAKDITRALLAGISQYRAKIVIVDITGVPIVDSGVADHLNKTIQAARLKGAQTIITGMSDAVAEAIIDLGIDWSNIQTLSDLQTGLMVAIRTLGLKLVHQ
jgi:PAS domain S-box-containing protein